MDNMVDKEELLATIIYLKGLFQPETFDLFQKKDTKRSMLVGRLRNAMQCMCNIAGEMQRPDIGMEIADFATLSFKECCNYMLYYVRLALGQGDGDTFINLWKKGVAAKLADNLLNKFDELLLPMGGFYEEY